MNTQKTRDHLTSPILSSPSDLCISKTFLLEDHIKREFVRTKEEYEDENEVVRKVL